MRSLHSLSHAFRTPLAAACLVGSAAAGASAQTPATPSPNAFTLRAAVDSGLAHRAELRTAERRVDGARGAVVSAAASFDPQLWTNVQQTRDGDPIGAFGSVAAGQSTVLVTNALTYGTGVTTLLRNGISVTPQVGVTRTALSLDPSSSTSRATAGVIVKVPLLRDWKGGLVRGAERAAVAEYDATVLDYRQTAAAGVYEVAATYWQYAAASSRLAILQGGEARAQTLVDETRVLVTADERTPAELRQLESNAASKRVQRLSAEQLAIDAWGNVVLATGQDARAAATPRPVGTALPSLGAAADTSAFALLPAHALVEEALSHRTDYAALTRRREGAQTIASAAEHDLKPRIDVSVGLGYTGAGIGLGVDRFLSPLARSGAGLNTTLGFSYQMAATNALARGRLLESTAAMDEQTIAQTELARRITTAITTGVEAMRRGALALRAAESAVALARASIDDEKTRFKLGANTLFDVILAEDALTSALLAEVDAQQTYALALASLRYETGALAPARDAPTAVDARLLSTPPLTRP